MSQVTAAQPRNLDRSLVSTSCPSADSLGALTVHAPQQSTQFLSLCDGHSLGVSRVGNAQPLSLASGDFDSDGVPDLVSGFATGQGGSISVHRGNVNALWPYGAALRNGPPPAFFPNARVFTLPESPDFLVTGDFDADGHLDVMAAHRGSSSLYFLRGDGHGGFGAAKRLPIAGNITTMIAGEINRADGLADLVVAITSSNGARALVFESPAGVVNAQPEIFKLPRAATSLALGRFDGTAMHDLAIAAGNTLVVIHGRDRKLSSSVTEQAKVAAARITPQVFAFSITSLVTGDFTGTGPSVAALGDDGRVHVLEHALSPDALGARAARAGDGMPSMQVSGPNHDGKPVMLSGHMTPSQVNRLAALRQAGKTAAEWTQRSTVSLPAGFGQGSPRLVAGRVSGSLQEDIIAVDGQSSQVHVLSTFAGKRSAPASRITDVRSVTPVPASMRLLGSLNAESAPAAVLPMRLNQHGLSGLVMLQAGQSEPTVMPQDVPPANVFTVTNTSDAVIAVGPEFTGPAGSLRKALYDSSQATGTSSIVFDIPTTDPGYKPATGTFLIQPLSEASAGDFNNFALNPINNTVTIDGYTQPGASPNTSATSDNAKILIQIDGAKAATPGGAGLVPFDDTGSIYRGIAFTGWTLGQIANNTESGAEGMEANGVADFIEGNFFGTDVTGKTRAPNRIGIFADNGPGLGNTDAGNTLGGTTPQARNILSGNSLGGVLFLSTAIEATLKGNFVGLDATGATALPNGSDGTGLNGPTVTIGGTLPGDGNVIAGNPTNVDINDITEGGAAKNSTVQGNLIGTDATGTKSPSGGKDIGVSIIAGPQDMLIGGTTPAARNIISGNNYGVYIFDGAFFNTVQGNYIGTDITGTKAVANATNGFATGLDTDPLVMSDDQVSAGDTTLGGAVAGAGNVISGNGADGVQIEGTSTGVDGEQEINQGNTILGNFIGSDPTGANAIPNGGSGVDLNNGSTNNIIGGSDPGSANFIGFNTQNGVLIDPGTATAGEGTGNNTVANIILSNGGAGVRMPSGTNNLISRNSIYNNGGLGIDLATAGPNANTHCNATNSGANNLQNSPVLTGGTGALFITATATDPNGNTSEFSNAVKATETGNILDLLGNFDSVANTNYTIEFFSSPTADASGFGEGQTYLGSTIVTTSATCTVAVSNPVDLTTADMSVVLTGEVSDLIIGPDFGNNVFTGTVTNNGPATAHSVTFTDTLPSQLAVSSAYCDVGPCQSSVTSTLGTCTVSGNTVTCDLGTMASGATATIHIPVEAITAGTVIDTASVSATEADPNLANNTSSLTGAANYPSPFLDHLDPGALLVNSPTVPMTVYGFGLLPNSVVTFNSTTLTTTGILNNAICDAPFESTQCEGIQVLVPASLLTTAGTPNITVTNPNPGPEGEDNFPSSLPLTIAASCTYGVEAFFNPVENDGTPDIPDTIEVSTNVQTCPWTVSSGIPWGVILDTYNQDINGNAINVVDSGATVGTGDIDVAFAPNTGSGSRTGTITVAGQPVAIMQDGGATCAYALSALTASPGSGGGTATFGVTTGSSCTYSSLSQASWISVAHASDLLTGNGTVSYTVAPNTGVPRSGTILVGGAAFTVNQGAAACYFTLSPDTATFPVAGGTGSIGVTASGSNCGWTATPSSSAISITSGATGTGNGSVSYSVPMNTGGPQTPTITVGNATANAVFTETQDSAYTCTFTVSPTPLEVSSNGTSNFFLITASYSFCKWTAASNNSTDLAINGNSSGTGTAAVYYSVAQNTGAARTLTITAGCQTFTVNQDAPAAANPAPTLTSLVPSSVAAGSGAFTLTVNGTSFVNGATVNFNGVALTTTFVSSTQVTAAVPAGDITTGGSASITVTNPTPGGGVSNALTLTITGSTSNPLPAITTLQPATVTAGSGAFTLTVNGSNFVGGSVVKFNGTAVTTTFGSATQLTAAIPTNDIATAGSASITVTNPTPGGGTSNTVKLTINPATSSNPVPAITTLQPATVTAGSGAFTLTVNGSNFISSSVVKFNGTAVTTTFGSATKLTAAIPASDIATAGSASITVTNPTPGGGTSNAVKLTINAATAPNPVPAITTLQPAAVTAGSGAFTLTVNGSNFISSSVVKFNGTAVTTTFGSATKLTAAIPASDIATAGTASITVTNPAPGGGTSNSVTLTINAVSNPVPAITALQPASVNAGSGAFTLSINGSNFVSTSVVKLNGSARTTTYVSATQLKAAIQAGDVATAGTAPITVTNPTPGGGVSNTVNLTIAVPPPAPVVTFNPTTLTFNGTQVTKTAAAQTVTLSNTGNALLTLSGITITGSDASAFSQTNTCGSSVAAGADCTISVTFAPTSATSLSASISVADNAAGSPQTVSLTGTGTPGPTFTITSSTATQTIQSGGTALYSVTVSAQNGFASAVSLAVTGLPPGATASFSPASVTPGSSPATSQLNIKTAGPVAAAGIHSVWPMAAMVPPFLGLFLAMGRRRKRWMTLAVLLLASMGTLTAVIGCGGGFASETSKTYSITITGTSGALKQSTPVTLIVE